MNLAENKPVPVPQFLKFNWQKFLSQITGKNRYWGLDTAKIDLVVSNGFIYII